MCDSKKPKADKFWCGLCDEIKPIAEYSHVANLMGLQSCKDCNSLLLKGEHPLQKCGGWTGD